MEIILAVIALVYTVGNVAVINHLQEKEEMETLKDDRIYKVARDVGEDLIRYHAGELFSARKIAEELPMFPREHYDRLMHLLEGYGYIELVSKDGYNNKYDMFRVKE